MLGCLSTLALVAAAIGAGLGHYSFWWTLLPGFLAGSLSLSNGPAYSTIVRANEEGRLGVFPVALAFSIAVHLALAGAAYWITTAIA
jgi:hypothetical protein